MCMKNTNKNFTYWKQLHNSTSSSNTGIVRQSQSQRYVLLQSTSHRENDVFCQFSCGLYCRPCAQCVCSKCYCSDDDPHHRLQGTHATIDLHDNVDKFKYNIIPPLNSFQLTQACPGVDNLLGISSIYFNVFGKGFLAGFIQVSFKKNSS